ncbi:MAG: hypothetical protein HC880_05225 [Bacteroidia bacterium]|nr:hypothetical protein [Bacteroidia bacterium]
MNLEAYRKELEHRIEDSPEISLPNYPGSFLEKYRLPDEIIVSDDGFFLTSSFSKRTKPPRLQDWEEMLNRLTANPELTELTQPAKPFSLAEIEERLLALKEENLRMNGNSGDHWIFVYPEKYCPKSVDKAVATSSCLS